MTNKFILDNVLLFIPLRMGNICLGLMGSFVYLALCIRLIILFTIGSHLISYQIYIISIPLSLVQSILCLIFVVGILKRNRYLLMPWLLSQILMTTLVALNFILSRSQDGALLMINWILFQAYIWLCGWSLYTRTISKSLEYNISSTGSAEHPEFIALENVLFSIPLRTGNILLGLTGTVFYLLLSVCFIIKSTRAHHFSEKFNLGVMIILSLIQSIVCAIFVAGIIKKKRNMLLPWLFSQILVIFVPVIVYFLVVRSNAAYPLAIDWILVQSYIWFCGYSIFLRSNRNIHPTIKYNVIPSNESDTSRRRLKLLFNQVFDQLPETSFPVLENVLFMVPLQIGNIIIGLTSAIFYMATSIYLMSKVIYYANHYSHIPMKFFYISMINVLPAHSIMCAIFVAGILKRKRRLVMAWLFSQILITIATVIIYYTVYHRRFDFVTLAINWIIIQTYIWFCGYSIYKRMPTRGAEYNIIPSSESADTLCTEKYSLINYEDFILMFKVPVLNNVLFFISLRVGNIILGLIGTILYLVLGICFLIKSKHNALNFSDKLYFILMISILLVHSILCASFVFGILKKNRRMKFPLLFCEIFLTTTAIAVQFNYNPNQVVIPLVIYWIQFRVYVWLCGYSIYQCTPTRATDYSPIPSTESYDFSHCPKVPILERVLFIVPLRIGNVVLGLIGTIFYLMISICFIIQSTKLARNFTDKFYFISLICIFLVHSVHCAIFVVGILKKQQRMLLPWLHSQVIMTVAAVALHFMRYQSYEFVTLAISWILFQSYIWLCGYSTYQLISTKGTEYRNLSSTEYITNEDFLKDLPILENVLFCIPLKIGNICMGLTAALVYFVLGTAFINKYTSTHTSHIAQKFYFLSMISVLLIHAVACIIFVIGILKKKPHMLLSWLFSQILIIFVPVALQCLVYRSPDLISFAINWILLQAYIWYCGFSFIQRSHTRSAEYDIIPSSETNKFSKILLSCSYQDLDNTYLYKRKLNVCNTNEM